MIAHDKLLAASEAKPLLWPEELYNSLSECLQRQDEINSIERLERML